MTTVASVQRVRSYREWCFAGISEVFCLLCAGLPTAWGAPVISVDRTSMGFGSVPDDRPVEHCFVIGNSGDTVLTIDRITEDCGGCLSYRLETNAVPPGRSAMLEVTLDTGVVEGSVAKNIVLHTNDPETPVLILSLWGTVSPMYTVRPRSVLFNPADTNSAVTQTVHIVTNFRTTDPLSAVSNGCGFFTAALLPGADAGICDLRVGTAPPLPEGMTRGEIVLAGTNLAGPRCVVRVAAYVPPVFSVLPDKLVLRPADEEQMKIVFVRQNSSKPAGLLDVVVPMPGFTCEINPGPGPGDYRIYVRARGLAGKQGLVANLIIKTDDPSHAEVIVPVEVR